MQLEIFDVEHGACALLTCDDGKRLMIDCGHSAGTGFFPGQHLRRLGVTYLDMLAITNYDEDHVSGLPDLQASVNIGWLWRNKTVTPENLKALKSQDGMGDGIDALVAMAKLYTGSSSAQPPEFPGVMRSAYGNAYPDFTDENNLSLAVHLSINGVGFLFPGDLECEGWRELRETSAIDTALQSTNVLVASHHSRESGICEEIFDQAGCRPFFVVISDKGYMYDTQRTVPFYRQKARGGVFRGEQRAVLTTRNDGNITFKFTPHGWWAE